MARVCCELLAPSPKSQSHEVGAPLDVSANCIVCPLIGVAVKDAVGAVGGVWFRQLPSVGESRNPLVNAELQPVLRSLTVTVTGVATLMMPLFAQGWVLKVKPCGGAGTMRSIDARRAAQHLRRAAVRAGRRRVTSTFWGEKFAPVMVTFAPVPPLFGLMPVIGGSGIWALKPMLAVSPSPVSMLTTVTEFAETRPLVGQVRRQRRRAGEDHDLGCRSPRPPAGPPRRWGW